MATLVHPSSAESTTSQLDLFSVPPSQTSLEEGSFTEYHPLSVLTSTGPIEFTISAENSNYIDLTNSFLYVRAYYVSGPLQQIELDFLCLVDANPNVSDILSPHS